jgi:hypothetical protein
MLRLSISSNSEHLYLFFDCSCGLIASHRLSEKETDMRDKLDPSISYLRKLGPEYINQVLESSRWIFETDRHMAFEVILVHMYSRLLLTTICLIQDIYIGRR